MKLDRLVIAYYLLQMHLVPSVDPVLLFSVGQSHGFVRLVGAGTKNEVINHDSGNLQDINLTNTVLIMPPQAPSGLSDAPVSTYNFSAREKHIQQILAVTLSTTGILYALVSIYWFARMKRIFRHQYVNCCYLVPFVRSPGPLISSQTHHVADYEWLVQIIVVLHPGCFKPCLWSYIASVLPG